MKIVCLIAQETSDKNGNIIKIKNDNWKIEDASCLKEEEINNEKVNKLHKKYYNNTIHLHIFMLIIYL